MAEVRSPGKKMGKKQARITKLTKLDLSDGDSEAEDDELEDDDEDE